MVVHCSGLHREKNQIRGKDWEAKRNRKERMVQRGIINVLLSGLWERYYGE